MNCCLFFDKKPGVHPVSMLERLIVVTSCCML